MCRKSVKVVLAAAVSVLAAAALSLAVAGAAALLTEPGEPHRTVRSVHSPPFSGSGCTVSSSWCRTDLRAFIYDLNLSEFHSLHRRNLWHGSRAYSFWLFNLTESATAATDEEVRDLIAEAGPEAASRLAAEPIDSLWLAASSFGWPFRCLSVTVFRTEPSADFEIAEGSSGVILVDPAYRPPKWEMTPPRVFPLTVEPAGLVLNMATYSLMWVTAVRAAGGCRGLIRRRGGRCAKCGYDLRGSESGRCPECGSENPLPHSRSSQVFVSGA